MATFHFSIKPGKVGNAEAHCEYINRVGRYAKGKKKEDLVYKANSQLPYWAKDINQFFEYADGFERANGNAYYKFEVGLPAELSLEENIKLVYQLVDEHIGKNKVWCFAIHDKMATLEPNQRQPHAHIMVSERIVTDWDHVKFADKFFSRYNGKNPQQGGYLKDRRFTQNKHEASKRIYEIRKYWETIINEAYKRNGYDISVSCETLKVQRQQALEQGDYLLAEELDRPAQIHLGPKLAGQMKRLMERDNFKIEMLPEKAQVAYLAREINKINKKIREQKEFVINQQLENQNVDVETKTINGKELKSKIDDVYVALKQRLNKNKAKITSLKKEIKSDEGIESMALSIYTKGATKELNKRARYIANLIESYELEKASLVSDVENHITSTDSEEYINAKHRLKAMESEIAKLQYRLNADQEYVANELSQEKHQILINKIKQVLFDKRDVNQKFVADIQKENETILNITIGLLKVKKKLEYRHTYEVASFSVSDFKEKTVSEIKKILKSIQNATDANEFKRKNKMIVRLSSNHEESNENDIGI